jgi:hypothetical protein
MNRQNNSDGTVTELGAERLGSQLVASESDLCLLQNIQNRL